MPGKLTVTVRTTLNIRRGPTNAAGIVGRAAIGQQFDVIQILDTENSKEQWARIEHDNFDQAYICTRTSSGSILALVSMSEPAPIQSEEFIRGWNACVDALDQVVKAMKK
jgi:hypothetical protein